MLRLAAQVRVIEAAEGLDDAFLQILALESVQVAVATGKVHEFLDRESHVLKEAVSKLVHARLLHVLEPLLAGVHLYFLGEFALMH